MFWLFSRNLPWVWSAYTSRRMRTQPSYNVCQLRLNQISCIFCSFILDVMFYYLSLSGFTHFLMSIFWLSWFPFCLTLIVKYQRYFFFLHFLPPNPNSLSLFYHPIFNADSNSIRQLKSLRDKWGKHFKYKRLKYFLNLKLIVI